MPLLVVLIFKMLGQVGLLWLVTYKFDKNYCKFLKINYIWNAKNQPNMKKLLLLFSFTYLLFLSNIGYSQVVCGSTFTDSGGANANYQNNENITYTICPTNSTDLVTLTFISFALENNFDFLKIYDGTSPNATLIANLTGTTIPNPISSSIPGGCLTIVFTSDGSITAAGWVANITCTSPSNCPSPVQLFNTNVTTTSAVINWTEIGTATSWEVLVLPCNSTPPSPTATGIIVTSNPYTLSGLTPSTCYDVYVRSICSASESSNWSTKTTFTTLSTCPNPTSLSFTNITSNSATISWTNNSSATSWEVLALPCNSNPPTTTTTGGIIANTNPFTLTGLNGSTCYSIYVRAICSTSDISNWSLPITITTPNSPPACGGNFVDSGGATGNYANNEDLTTTICPSNPGDQVTVTFISFNTETNWDGLYVFDGNSVTSPQIASTNAAGNVPGGLSGAFWGTTIPGPFTSSDPSGCLTFRFRSDGSVVQAGWNANITCSPGPTCPKPTTLIVNTITTTTATIGWTSNSSANSWELLALPCGSNPPTATTTGGVISTINPFVLNGLTQNTCYDVYVRGICSANDTSLWSPKVTFTTLASCPKPTALVTTNVTTNSVTLAWTNNSSASSWEVLALPCGTTPTITSTGTITTINPYTITGLNSASCYNLYVRAICSSSDLSQWSSSVTITTTSLPPVCGGNFVDSGGANANYANNEDITTTICPTNPNEVVTVTFTSFNIESNWDGLYVFNGNSINASQISSSNTPGNVPGGLAGAFWGTTIPGPFTSTSADGCLTFRFRSDGSITNPGWVANVTCVSVDRIILNAYVDANNNGVKDTNELNYNHGSFLHDVNNSGINTLAYSPTGIYILTDSNTSNLHNFAYQVQSEYAPYYSSGTTSYSNITIPTNSGSQILYFPIIQTQTYNEASISIVPISAPRPGLTYINKIVYTNNGTGTIATGTITFVKPTPVTTVTTTQAGTTANATGFTYNYTNLLPNETRSFYVTMTVPAVPIVNANDLLTATASITVPSGDIDLTNNNASNSQIVVNSYDPNDKMESRGDKIVFSSFSPDDYFYYTIRFENTGTANAIDVRITDILNVKIDEATVRMVSASHDYKMNRIGNNLTWMFDNIQLPVSVPNTLTGKGYVTFKVKLKPGFVAGDIIPNNANIFFDTNPPITTNTFNSKFITLLGLNDFENGAFILYPNPTDSFVTIQLSNSNENISGLIIYDLLGKSILNIKNIDSNQKVIDVSNISKGVYLLQVETSEKTKTIKKLIVE
jgi:hypothetical protein